MCAGMHERMNAHACERSPSSRSLLPHALPAPGHPPRMSNPRAGTVSVSLEATLGPWDPRNSVKRRVNPPAKLQLGSGKVKLNATFTPSFLSLARSPPLGG